MKTEKTILIGRNLKKARESKGLTQSDVMRIRGYESTSTVSSHESGVRTPKAIELYELSKLYDVSMEWLHGENDRPQKLKDQDREMLREEGKIINELIKESGLSYRELSIILGIEQEELMWYIDGITSPTLDIIFKMCTALGMSRKDFFSRMDGEELGYDHKIKNVAPETKATIDTLIKVDEISKEHKKNNLLSFSS